MWEPRIDRMMGDEELAGHAWRGLMVLLAEGDPAAVAFAQTPEGKAILGHAFPKLPSH
jgi:hypothetical protein